MRSFYPLSSSVLRFTGIQNCLQLYRKERSLKKDLCLHLGIELETSRAEGRAPLPTVLIPPPVRAHTHTTHTLLT